MILNCCLDALDRRAESTRLRHEGPHLERQHNFDDIQLLAHETLIRNHEIYDALGAQL